MDWENLGMSELGGGGGVGWKSLDECRGLFFLEPSRVTSKSVVFMYSVNIYCYTLFTQVSWKGLGNFSNISNSPFPIAYIISVSCSTVDNSSVLSAQVFTVLWGRDKRIYKMNLFIQCSLILTVCNRCFTVQIWTKVKCGSLPDSFLSYVYVYARH